MTADQVRPIVVLSRALDQMGDVLALVHPEHADLPTPCHQWPVGRLVDHVVADPGNFLKMMRGEQPDWSAEPPHIEEDWAGAFRVAADDLIHAWHQQGEAGAAGADWQSAEFAVHTWDLLRGLGRPTDRLDPEVAERGLAFMRANLTPENRGGAFGPERPAPADAAVYEQLAAFSGREV